MTPRRRTALIRSYLGVSLIGWFLFGIFARAQLDLIGNAHPDAIGIALVIGFGVVMSVGTGTGYATIRLAGWDRGNDLDTRA